MDTCKVASNTQRSHPMLNEAMGNKGSPNSGQCTLLPNVTGQCTLLPNATGQCTLLPNATGQCILLPNATGLCIHATGQCTPLPNATGQCTLLPNATGQCTLLHNTTGQCTHGTGQCTLLPSLGTQQASNIGLGTQPSTNAGLGTLPSSNSNINLGILSPDTGLGNQTPNAGLGTLPPNGSLSTLPPYGGLGTLPPNGGLGTMPPSAGMYAPFQQLGLTPYPGMSNSMGHQSTLPQTIPSGHSQSMPMVLPQTIPTSRGVMPPPHSHTPSVPPNLGLPVQPPPLSQLPHIVSYPNLSNMASSSSSGQPEQTKKFDISEVSEGSPVTLVSFGETTVVMDNCAHQPVSTHVTSTFTAPPPLSPLVDCSPMEMPIPEPHPQAGGFLPAESQALFNEAFGQFLYNMHCLFTTPTMQPLLQQLSNHFGKRADTVSLGTLPLSNIGQCTLLPNAGLGTQPASNIGLGTKPASNVCLGTPLPLSNIGLGNLSPNTVLSTLPTNARLDILPTNAGLGTLPASNAGRGTQPPTNACLGTLPSSTSNIDLGILSSNIGLGDQTPNAGLGTLPPDGGLGTLQPNGNLGTLPPNGGLGTLPPNGGLGTLPPNGGLGTLPPNGGLGTLPPNGGLGTMPPSAGMYAPFQQLGQTPYPGTSNSVGHQSSLPQTIPSGHSQSMPIVLPQTIPTSQGVMPPPPSHTPSIPPNLGLPIQPPPLSQLPHIVSYPNLASSSSGQPEQTKKISEVSEGSPVTLVSFGETTVVMDSCVEGEEEMEEEDTLESSDSNMYDFTQPPLTPAKISGAQPSPLHHHHHHQLNGAVVSDNSGHAHSMSLPAIIGRSKRSRYSLFETMQPLLQQLSNHFGKRADTVGEVSSLSTSSESTSHLPSSQPVVSVVYI